LGVCPIREFSNGIIVTCITAGTQDITLREPICLACIYQQPMVQEGLPVASYQQK